MNLVVPIVCAIFLGYLCASFIFNQYGFDSMVFQEKDGLYFLQCGSYTTKEASETKIEGISKKITVKEGDKYYSYIGMTSSKKIAESIKESYAKKGIDIYIKNYYIENLDFINQVKQYDILLESSNTLDETNSVLKTILATYEEIMLDS